ncbi:hypothetical protein [Nocardia paucivorans]|uniref:hypothetical protein n=1 Tax=Nocardia paucivorans TaxID=114259 RepID=UPI0002E87E98|nr:hypothetical protein [Nocardia paucivorans]
MSSPLDQSVLDILRQSAAGSMLDRPVNDVLKDMGLPTLPEISALPPLPEFPPLPVLDLSLLAKPLTDLASSFGTGRLPADAPMDASVPGENPASAPVEASPPVDPAQVFSQVSSVVQTAISLGASALQIAMSLWQGAGASAAAEKAGQAATDGAAVSAQSAETSVGVTAAAGTVFQGATMMSATIARFMTSLAAAAPWLPTPPGQVFVLSLTTETLAEATAIVAKTRGELAVHSAAMTKTGAKVPVTGAPKHVDPTQTIQQLMQLVGPLTQMATTGAQALQAAHTALNPAKSISDQDKELDKARFEAPKGVVGGIGGGAVGVGGVAGQPRQLASWGSARTAGPLGPAGASALAAESSAATSSSPVRAVTSTPGMMPMGGVAGAAGMAARSGEQSAEGLRGLLVTEQHGNEVVGDIEGVSLPVVGATDHVSEPPDSEPPDKSLTL